VISDLLCLLTNKTRKSKYESTIGVDGGFQFSCAKKRNAEPVGVGVKMSLDTAQLVKPAQHKRCMGRPFHSSMQASSSRWCVSVFCDPNHTAHPPLPLHLLLQSQGWRPCKVLGQRLPQACSLQIWHNLQQICRVVQPSTNPPNRIATRSRPGRHPLIWVWVQAEEGWKTEGWKEAFEPSMRLPSMIRSHHPSIPTVSSGLCFFGVGHHPFPKTTLLKPPQKTAFPYLRLSPSLQIKRR